MSKTVTIYKIAEEAGVSPATVSRVLTGNSKVSAQKQERVREMIEKYNFSPNAMAKGLSESRSKTIGMICAEITNPFFSSLFVACERESYRQEYNLALYNTFSQTEFELQNLRKLSQQRAEAIIIVGGQIDQVHPSIAVQREIERIAATIPVIITAEVEMGRARTVSINQERAMEEAVDYLLSLGHRRIVNISGHPEVLSTIEKNRVFLARMVAAGARPNGDSTVFCHENYYNFESGTEAMERILQMKERPTAVICTNDMCAAGALRVLQQHGLQVPADMSLVSFDNTYISDITNPKLTSVGYDYAAFAKMLVGAAVGLIEKGKPKRRMEVIPKLVIKDSCAPWKAE